MDKPCRNIEIKAKLPHSDDVIKKAKSMSSEKIISQTDTFFHVNRGRLKLRREKDENTLIYYERPDCEGPKLSNYTKCNISDGEGLEATLAASLGVKGVVKKTRHLFIVGQTRVHLDNVEGLGYFMELEVVLNDNDTIEDGQKIASELMQEFGVKKEDLIAGAYIDMLLKK